MELESPMDNTTTFQSVDERNDMSNAKLDFEHVPAPKDLNELCQILHKVFEKDHINVEYVTKIMENYKSNPKDWRKYAKYDPHKYTRNLIDEGNGKFNILLLCWAESQGSSIHDHSNAHCFLKCLDGDLLETQYEWPALGHLNTEQEEREEENVGVEMVEKQRTPVKKNDVAYINGSVFVTFILFFFQ